MRAAALTAAAVIAALGTGCTTIVDVAYDDARDFSHYRTWSWLPHGVNVSALPGEERKLATLTSRLVERALRERGLEPVEAGADLLVGCELRVQRRLVVVNETGANQLLASHHSSPSYLVQSTTQRIQVYEHGYLQLVVTDGGREELVWRGELWGRHRGEFAPHLENAVVLLLESFPAGKTPQGQSSSGTVGPLEETHPKDARSAGCDPGRLAAAAGPGAGADGC